MTIRDKIVDKVEKAFSDLIIVNDNDGLILWEEVLRILKSKGYRIIDTEDPMELRFKYEEDYRLVKGATREIDYKILIRHSNDYDYAVPCDISSAGHEVNISLSEFFPGLDINVLKSLSNEDLKKLFIGYKGSSDYMGEIGSKKYILSKLYNIDLDRKYSLSEVLEMLIKRHYNGINIPHSLDSLILETFTSKKIAPELPMSKILSDKSGFFEYLQSEWNKYVESLMDNKEISSLPFKDNNIRVYLDNLFVENYLKPVKLNDKEKIPLWAEFGIFVDKTEFDKRRLNDLLRNIEANIPNEESPYNDWFVFAVKWADILRTYYRVEDKLDGSEMERFSNVHNRVEEIFEKWMLKNFSPLAGLSFLPHPKTVDKILNYLSFLIEKGNRKIILLVMDGMAVDHWTLLKEHLNEDKRIRCEESLLFAWVPTITSVSRKVIFSGKKPVDWEEEWSKPNENKLWKDFWNKQRSVSCDYYKNFVIDKADNSFFDEIDNKNVVGIIINTLDDISHGIHAELGRQGLYRDTEDWLKKVNFKDFIARCLNKGFRIIITSDHGNICSKGIGKPNEGVLSDTKGERVRIFDSESTLKIVSGKNPGIEWNNYGLPENMRVFLSKGREAFKNKDEKLITHGGISLEEVIVPFIVCGAEING